MRVWVVDIAMKNFTVLIDVQEKPEWTSLVSDIAGVSDMMYGFENYYTF